jgi:hypothetical protein
MSDIQITIDEAEPTTHPSTKHKPTETRVSSAALERAVADGTHGEI